MQERPAVPSTPFLTRTFSSLRYRNFRLYWFGSCAEHVGKQMETMASAWLMMELTASPYYLGLLTFCKVAPLFLFAFLGGAVADRFDRRKLLILSFWGSGAVSTALLLLARAGTIAPWHLLLAGVLNAAFLGVNHPARDAVVPNLTPPHEWMNAIALDTISVRTASVLGAVLAGNFIALFGTSPLFGISAVGMLLAIFWMLRTRVPAAKKSAPGRGTWNHLKGGLGYAAANGLIVSLIFVFALREFQSEMGSTFLPFFADEILHSGAAGFGYLTMAQGLGGAAGLFGVASLGDYRYKGRLVILAGLLVGGCLIGFSLSTSLLLSVLLLIAASVFGTVFENVGRTALQTLIPDEMRGRIMSLREVVRGFIGSWASFGLGLGGEYLGVVLMSIFLGLFIMVSVLSIYLLLPAFRRL